jgi:hypothetical protein
MSAAGRTLPLEDAPLAAVMVQLKNIANVSYESLLVANGPPQPDYVLLDLCADALNAAKYAALARAERDRLRSIVWAGSATGEVRTAADAACEERQRLDNIVTQACRRAAKLEATTPAGIYAKALIVRCSSTGASALAMSLATDLVECKGLRDVLWPAGEVPA